MPSYEFFLAGPLEKVFADRRPAPFSHPEITALKGDVPAFQLVYSVEESRGESLRAAVEGIKSELYSVRLVPSLLPCPAVRDTNYLRTEPGLFPDLLTPSDGNITPVEGQFRSLWIRIPTENAEPGSHPVTVRVFSGAGELLFQEKIKVWILPVELPEQTLLHTEWFHADCLANYYHVPPFGAFYWQTVENFIRFAARRCGVNVLLTPVFTPPLDTEEGRERTDVQLVDIEKKGGRYRFGFEKLKRWCGICRKFGIERLEIPPLFTQWGAKATPNIYAEENGSRTRIFGWDVPSGSPKYRGFLKQFLPQLVSCLNDLGFPKKNLYFHLSDEPSKANLENYAAARKQAADLLEGLPVIDALSDFSCYESGIVRHPVVATSAVEPFLEHHVPDLWVYYCCGQGVDVPNRFFSTPSARNRMMGILMYRFRIHGFLHWGYNFYSSRLSRRAIDPYAVTDGDCGFPSGDPFLVYPAQDGTPYSSIRNEVQMEGLADMRALTLLEQMTDRKEVESLLERGLSAPLSFRRYPHSAAWLLRVREKVNLEIAALRKVPFGQPDPGER